MNMSWDTPTNRNSFQINSVKQEGELAIGVRVP